jgi:hypothetical protein
MTSADTVHMTDQLAQTVVLLWDLGDLRGVYAATAEGRAAAEADFLALGDRYRADWAADSAVRSSMTARGYREPDVHISEVAVLSQRSETIWRSMLADALAETGGPLTEVEAAWADHVLGHVQKDG